MDIKEERRKLNYVIDHEYSYVREVFVHYMKSALEKAGAHYDYDNEAELNGLIDSLQKAVEFQIKLALLHREEGKK